jgi:hypothetical protein
MRCGIFDRQPRLGCLAGLLPQPVRRLRRSAPHSSSPRSSRRRRPDSQSRRGCLVRLRPQQLRHRRRSGPSSSSPRSSRRHRPGRHPLRGCLVRRRRSPSVDVGRRRSLSALPQPQPASSLAPHWALALSPILSTYALRSALYVLTGRY